MNDLLGNLADEAKMFEGFLLALKDDLSAHPGDVLRRPVAITPSAETQKIEVKRPRGKDVFIVHGHDELNLYRLKDLLRERYKLEPIVLSAKAGKGRLCSKSLKRKPNARLTHLFC